jgi:serine/threonine-protein kinase
VPVPVAGANADAIEASARTAAMPAAVPPTTAVTRTRTPPRSDTSRTGTFAVLIVLVLIVLLAILILLFTGGGSGGGNSGADRVPVPNVISKPVADAQAQLTAEGFQPQVQEEDNDNFAPGTVFNQDPLGGTRVDKGSTVVLKVSRGNATLRVPGVIGSTVDQAEQTLLAQGFKVTRQPDPASPAPEGQVTRQDPEPGTLLAIGQTVTIVFSSPEEKQVPDLKGQDPVAATSTLVRLGFDVERKDESSDTIEQGKVTRTDPAAGAPLKVGQKITLYVSSGLPQGVVPTLVSLSTDAAVKAIRDAGFEPDARPQDVPAGSAEAGRVISQNPPPNTNARKGTTVVIVYGRPQSASTTTAPSATSTPTTVTTTPTTKP